MVCMCRWILALCVVGCSEYKFGTEDDPPNLADTDTDADTDADADADADSDTDADADAAMCQERRGRGTVP